MINIEGLLDSLSFVGRIIGYIFLTVYPIRTPKKDFFKMCIATSLFLTLIPLASTFPKISHLMLAIGMILSGISRAYILIPNMIMLQYFDVHQNTDRILINFFAALSTMGDVFAIVITSIFISFGISWKACFVFSLVVFFVCTVFLTLIAE